MNFTEYYYIKEAKLGTLRQFLNLFSKEKKININLDRDIQKKGYFSETDKSTFDTINDALSKSYATYISLQKRKKGIKYSHSEDKILARTMMGRAMEKEAQTLIINVFNINIKGGDDLISPYTSIPAAAAYETGKHLIHYGYITMIITENNGELNYFVGADRLGLKFFKELFGTNMDMYILSSKKEKSKGASIDIKKSEINEPEAFERPSKKEIAAGQDLYVDIGGSNELKITLLNDIKDTWGAKEGIKPGFKNRISEIKPAEIKTKLGTLQGYEYRLIPSREVIGVYTRGAYGKDATALKIVFYGGEKTVDEAKRLRFFDDLKSIEKPEQIFKSITSKKI